MITYPFICNNCGNEFELHMGYSAYLAALFFHCPECNSSDVKRVYESNPIQFKGKDFTKSLEEE